MILSAVLFVLSCAILEGVTAAPELCSLPPETGLCRGYFPRYHYDPKSNTCRRFIYGGCGGNDNSFETEAECTKSCGGVALREDETPICRRPPSAGNCKAAIPRFYFDHATKTCKEFTWGGCDSNGNNFHNHEECMTACEDEIEVCERPPKTGMCRAYFERFYYDPKTRSCKKFVYGGCDSNGNNFGSVKKCLEACVGNLMVL